jgi:predicted Zn-dependent protease
MPSSASRDSRGPGFCTTADLPLPAMVHARSCGCPLHARRRVAGWLAAGSVLPTSVFAQDEEGVRGEVGRTSRMAKLVPAEQVERAAQQQYLQLQREASSNRALAPADHPQVQRLRAIADRITPFAPPWNDRANQWKWEVSLFGSSQLNAFCMPGGKIAFYYGILQRLQLTDDEVAMIMGHEMAHALREHARERMGKSAATGIGLEIGAALLGLKGTGRELASMGAQLLTLRFGREDESEADLVGLDLAARAGYNPASGVTLWQKMMKASEGAPPEFLSTHPSGDSRIEDIQRVLRKVDPLYARAPKPPKVFGPPAA